MVAGSFDPGNGAQAGEDGARDGEGEEGQQHAEGSSWRSRPGTDLVGGPSSRPP